MILPCFVRDVLTDVYPSNSLTCRDDIDILKVHAKKIKVGDNVDYAAVARAASGASGAELANIVNEAALRAVRDNRKFVTQADLEESVEVVIAGYQKKEPGSFQ